MIMPVQLNVSELIQCGLEPNQVREFLDQIADLDVSTMPMACPGGDDTGDAATADAGE